MFLECDMRIESCLTDKHCLQKCMCIAYGSCHVVVMCKMVCRN